ncbi:hypothetical protein RJ640_010717 [Escallonia rubra]|uniref:Retrovirus-related Pol polyprotein from transposon TNT 1-94 n=1 Tax=Escallonia rubra TaxID=112253 RepID=A0AA88RIZ1_9ASTE|nr:hypothetical protein RJ640_010717 [Escallonia rubra]
MVHIHHPPEQSHNPPPLLNVFPTRNISYGIAKDLSSTPCMVAMLTPFNLTSPPLPHHRKHGNASLSFLLTNLARRSIPKYHPHMRAIADDLALVDNPLFEDDLVLYFLAGLGPEFKEITAALRARDNQSISFDELYIKLGDYELHLKKEDPTPSLSIASTNYTHRQIIFIDKIVSHL